MYLLLWNFLFLQLPSFSQSSIDAPSIRYHVLASVNHGSSSSWPLTLLTSSVERASSHLSPPHFIFSFSLSFPSPNLFQYSHSSCSGKYMEITAATFMFRHIWCFNPCSVVLVHLREKSFIFKPPVACLTKSQLQLVLPSVHNDQ